MAPRRSHKKSRYGCDSCRQRRVKCDEQGPPCTQCFTRKIDCHFSKRPPSRQLSANPSDDTLREGADSNLPTTTSEERPSEESIPKPSQRDLELELLHYYSTKTYQSLAILSPDEGLWQVFAVEEALKFDFLMKEIFALAALHKAMETPDSTIEYVNYALKYQNEASALFRGVLQNMNQENSSAIFIFSVMTLVFAIIPLEPAPGITGKSSLEIFHVLFEFQKGSASLVSLSKQWLKSSPFKWIFGPRSTNTSANVNENFNAALTNLENLNTDFTSANTSNFQIFSRAIRNLSFCSIGGKGRVIAWLAMAGDEFVVKVKEENPMALLILIHWAVLLETLSELWWARNIGEGLINDIASILEKIALSSTFECWSRWATTIDWAKRVARLKIEAKRV